MIYLRKFIIEGFKSYSEEITVENMAKAFNEIVTTYTHFNIQLCGYSRLHLKTYSIVTEPDD